MIPPLLFYQLAILGLLWLCLMLHLAWPSRGPVSSRWPGEPETPVKSRRKRSHESKPFVGLTHKPPCALCAHEASHPPPPLPMQPEPMPPTNRSLFGMCVFFPAWGGVQPSPRFWTAYASF
jgi:hypothetical protein